MKRLLTEASLIMKPEGQADGLLPSVKPLDGSGDFTFSRGSNLAATRVNQAGLIEKGRENLLLQSNKFDTTWSSINTTETSGQADKDGGTDAWLILKSASGARVQQAISVTGVQTFSVYAKANASNWIALWTNIGTSYFDLSSGTKGSTGASTTIGSAMESVGNGWYRCSLIFNTSISNVRIYPADGDLDTSGTSGSVYIQDAQLEKGLVATDYIESGATTAKAGILEDTPRLDYSGGATEPSLLLEPQRSNLITYSEYLNGSIWSHNSSTATINSDVSPSGYNDATSLYISLANAAVFSRAQFTNVANSTHIGSVFLKKVEGAEVRLRISGTAASLDGSAIFNLDNGTYRDAVGSVTPSIESVGNGWYRCSIGDLAGSGIATPSFRIDTLGAQNDTTVLVWGAVIEVGNYPTSYIPTMGSAVTRSVEDLGNILLPAFNDENKYSVMFNLTRKAVDINQTGDFFEFRKTNFAKVVRFWIDAPNAQVRFRDEIQSNATMSTIPFAAGDTKKICVVCNGTTFKTFVDGALIGTYNIVTPLSLSRLYMQSKSFDMKQLLVFKTSLIDAEAIALTKND